MSFTPQILLIRSPKRCSDEGEQALRNFRRVGRVPRTTVPLASFSLMGVQALRSLAAGHFENAPFSGDAINPVDELPLGTLPELIEEIASARRGVVLTMGKGGVGKTTVAAAVAVALADRGFAVHLSTTDPAAHVAATLNGTLPNLRVSRIDPQAEVAAYTAEVMATAGATLDEHGRALLEEDLRSPCTENLLFFAPLQGRSMADGTASSSSTRPRRGIRFCCWMLHCRITAKSVGKPANYLAVCSNCSPDCVTETTRAC